MSKTQLKKLTIEKFRALNNVEVELGEHITVICGKNGTSKSSILGIAAQIFSFEKDYVKDNPLKFNQIAEGAFKSQYSEHFRISETFDTPGSMTVNIELHDGYTDQSATAKLELMKRQSGRGKTLPRPVVRNNSTVSGKGNTSRNFTHPVIFLSLKRLYPIAARDRYNVGKFDYLEQHSTEFIGLTNELLNQSSSHAIGTDGTIRSAVAHGDNYDQESVSAGEDNAGQIILAIMSFRKLKEEYADYKGGLLLIDEADAGLFPTAQRNLLKILTRECKDLDLQVVMTSHSPVLIEYAFEQNQKDKKKYKTIYLSNTYGDVQAMNGWSWAQINADINTKTINTVATGVSLPKINVYFEDKEAEDFFAALMVRQPLKKFISPMSGITLGCANYLQLVKKNIPEFAKRSIICLDADQKTTISGRNFKTVVLLPGHLPPDQLIFEHMYNLPANHEFWNNELSYSRDIFTNEARSVLKTFSINGVSVDVKERLTTYQGPLTPRDVFKKFYNNAELQRLVSSGEKPYNPWRHWIASNPKLTNNFLNEFKSAIQHVMSSGYSVDTAKLEALKVKLRYIS